MDARLAALPAVKVRRDLAPVDLDPAKFLAAIVNFVLDAVPITLHREARIRAGRPYVDPSERKSRKKSAGADEQPEMIAAILRHDGVQAAVSAVCATMTM